VRKKPEKGRTRGKQRKAEGERGEAKKQREAREARWIESLAGKSQSGVVRIG
jgi:hypothetical protein